MEEGGERVKEAESEGGRAEGIRSSAVINRTHPSMPYFSQLKQVRKDPAKLPSKYQDQI